MASVNRNAAVEALRFFSIVQIAVGHLSGSFIAASFLGVEFYFILAGFFLYRNAVKPSAPGVIPYTINKVRKFYFEYLVAFLFVMCCMHKDFLIAFGDDWLRATLRIISELLMIQGTGGFLGGMNYPLWFFSVLIYGGAIIYALVRYYRSISIRVLFPLLVVLFMAHCFKSGSTSSLETWGVVGFVPYPMFRGMTEIAFGVLAGYLYFNYKQFFVINLRMLDIMSFISLVFYCIIIFSGEIYAPFVFVFIPLILMDALTPGSWMNRLFHGKVWIWLGSLSFTVFVIHAALVALCRHFLHVVLSIDLPIVLIVYLLILVPAAYIFQLFCRWLQRLLPLKIDFSPISKIA